MRSVNWAGALFLSAVTLCASGPAAAQKASVIERIRVKYRAPPDCPDRTAFIQQVQARTEKARVVEQGASDRVFWVEVNHEAEGYRGRLVIQDDSMAVREVQGDTCPEIVAALGLVTALAIDPKARIEPTPLPPAPPVSGVPEPPPGGVFVLPEVTDTPALSTAGAPSAPPPSTHPPPRLSVYGWPWPPVGQPLPVLPGGPDTAPGSSGTSTRLTLGAHAGAMSATTPDIAPHFGAFLELGSSGTAWLRPTLRGSFLFSPSSTTQVGTVGEATIGWLAGRLDGCPIRGVLADGDVRLMPCLGVDVGALNVDGVSGGVTQSHTRPWFSGLLFGRAAWTVTEPVVLEAQGGAMAPFVHDEFFFEPNTTAHQVPEIGGFFSGGIGVHIW